MPKDVTQISDYLRTYPNFDGRDITVAVCDTGVDPGAAGLQTTSHGKAKIIDLVDATGDGDVDMSTVKVNKVLSWKDLSLGEQADFKSRAADYFSNEKDTMNPDDPKYSYLRGISGRILQVIQPFS